MQSNLQALENLKEKLQQSKINQESLNKEIIQEIQNSLTSLTKNLTDLNERSLNSIVSDLKAQNEILFKELQQKSLKAIESQYTDKIFIYTIISFMIGMITISIAIAIMIFLK